MILNINKPLGLTSFDVVAAVRKATGIKKVGHAGTLDPMATGVLIVAVGRESTKKIDQLMAGEKEYVADIILGAETDSLDRDGVIMSTPPVPALSKERIDTVVQRFVGTIEQIPPMFSAVHYQGQRLYQLARKGKTVLVPPRIVTIHAIDILTYPESNHVGAGSQPAQTPSPFHHFTIRVTCEKGVYIRSLARDIGNALGTVAFLKGLVRTRIGDYHLENSLQLTSIPKIVI